MIAVLVIAVIALVYILATHRSRTKHTNMPEEWVTPGNGYGRHGYRAHKSR